MKIFSTELRFIREFRLSIFRFIGIHLKINTTNHSPCVPWAQVRTLNWNSNTYASKIHTQMKATETHCVHFAVISRSDRVTALNTQPDTQVNFTTDIHNTLTASSGLVSSSVKSYQDLRNLFSFGFLCSHRQTNNTETVSLSGRVGTGRRARKFNTWKSNWPQNFPVFFSFVLSFSFSLTQHFCNTEVPATKAQHTTWPPQCLPVSSLDHKCTDFGFPLQSVTGRSRFIRTCFTRIPSWTHLLSPQC